MTFRHLKIFIAVADCESMTKASKELYIAQPTVSQAVLDLEKYYGIKLFERLSKKLYITEDGARLLSYARHITSLFDEMELNMREPNKNKILRVGASVTVGSEILPALAKNFEETRGIVVNAVVKNTSEIESLIIKNTIDFALVEGVVHNGNIVSEAFKEDELVLVCGRSHPLYNCGVIEISNLEGYDFVVREQGSGTRELFESVMTSKNLSWNLHWECSGSQGIISAAINGIGIGVISKLLVKEELKTGKLYSIKIKDGDFKRKFSIIYHKNKYITAAMDDFFNLCRIKDIDN